MVYLVYFLFVMLFMYYTPIWNIIVKHFNNQFTWKMLSIIGDSIYMIGGGIVASVAFSNGYGLTLIFNGGTILIIVGAFIREFSRKILKED